MQRFNTAYKTLRAFMDKQVAERREEIRAELASDDRKSGKKDVFSMLVKANEMEEKEKVRLDDNELVSFFSVFFLLYTQLLLLALDWKYLYRSLRWAW
jgi:cytochrome P450